MAAVLTPPVAPMLARLAHELPVGEYRYEPKWDGFRCLAFRDGAVVELQSRRCSSLTRYFPEVVDALCTLPADELVVDGELVIVHDGEGDFDALLRRIHPSGRHVDRMVAEAPAVLVVFDLLALAGEDLTGRPFVERRARLERLLADAPEHLELTPVTDDPVVAGRWLEERAVVDGVVAKPVEGRYEPGKRAMVKVKPVRTADCVVAGCRLAADGSGVSSLLLGLYDEDVVLRHVGVAGSFGAARRRALVDELRPHVVGLDEHPWAQGFALEGGAMGRLPGSAGRWTPDMALDWVPLRPVLVCEAAYDRVDGRRWRHPGRFLRWRPDRDPASCTIDQLDPPEPAGGGGEAGRR